MAPVSRSSITERTVDPRARLRIWIFQQSLGLKLLPIRQGVSVRESSFFSFFLPTPCPSDCLCLICTCISVQVKDSLRPISWFSSFAHYSGQTFAENGNQWSTAVNLCTRLIFFIQIRLGTLTNQHFDLKVTGKIRSEFTRISRICLVLFAYGTFVYALWLDLSRCSPMT